MRQEVAHAWVGRQPIFDEHLEVEAYELLFRAGGDATTALFSDPDQATAEVFCSTFMDLGLESVVGRARAFINLSRYFLLGPFPELFPPDRVVLEVLEDVEPDWDVLERLRGLRAAGYCIALDDFVYHPRLEPLVEVADIVKLDVMQVTPEALAEHVAALRPHGVRILAEKVETNEELELCRELGCVLFQGFFFCRPQTMGGRRLPPDRLAALELVRVVHDPSADFEDLEAVISRDLSLSVRLLRYVNSAYIGLRVPIESIRHGLLLVGPERIRLWVSLLVLSSFSDKPHELMVTALLRGRMCRNFTASSRGGLDPERAFTVGMFSTLDALTDRPMEEVTSELGLASEVRDALVERRGALGEVLAAVLHYERGEWLALEEREHDVDALRVAYLEALQWTAEARGVLGEDASDVPADHA